MTDGDNRRDTEAVVVNAPGDYGQWLKKRASDPFAILLMTITLFGAWLRLAIVPHFAYWGDEFWTLEWCLRPVGEIMRSFRTGLTMHLYILFQKLWTHLFGFAPLVVRLPSLVAGIAIMPALYFFGRRWLGREAALLAALLYAASPFVIRYDRMARVYAILTLAIIFAMWWFLQALHRSYARDWLLLGLINAVLLTMSLNAVYVLLVQAAFCGLETVGRRLPWQRLAAAASALTLSVVLAAIFYYPARSDLWASIGRGAGSAVFRSELILEPLENLHFPTPWPSLALLAIGSWIAWRRGPVGRLLVLWALLPPLFYVLQRSTLSAGDIARYLMPTLPAQFLLVAAGLMLLLGYLARRPWQRLALAMGFVLAVSLGPATGRGLVFREMEPSTPAVARMVEAAAPGDRVTCHPVRFLPLLRIEGNLAVSSLQSLVSDPSLTEAGRLVVLTPALPEAREWWSQRFTVEVIEGPDYRLTLYVLTSTRQAAGDAALHDALEHFLDGFVRAVEAGARLYPTPTRHHLGLAEVHGMLARLALGARDTESARRHQHLADQHRRIADAEGRRAL